MKSFLTLALGGGMLFAGSKASFPDPPATIPAETKTGKQVAVFAGGCFWGVEAVFEHLRGVSNVLAGYAGGDAGTAQYEMVRPGKTGHAESVQNPYEPPHKPYGQLHKCCLPVA